MKFCTHCGNQLFDEAVICPRCGCSVSGTPQSASFGAEEDKVNGGLMVASILVPLVGIILAIMKWKTTPNAARSYLIAAIISWVAAAVIIGVFYGAFFAMMY